MAESRLQKLYDLEAKTREAMLGNDDETRRQLRILHGRIVEEIAAERNKEKEESVD